MLKKHNEIRCMTAKTNMFGMQNAANQPQQFNNFSESLQQVDGQEILRQGQSTKVSTTYRPSSKGASSLHAQSYQMYQVQPMRRVKLNQ